MILNASCFTVIFDQKIVTFNDKNYSVIVFKRKGDVSCMAYLKEILPGIISSELVAWCLHLLIGSHLLFNKLSPFYEAISNFSLRHR